MLNVKTARDLLAERKERIRRSVALEKNDRPPVVLQMSAYCARHMGVKLSEFCSSLQRSSEVMLASCKALGNVDGCENSFAAATLFPLSVLSEIKLPGRDLPDDEMWQMNEKELLSVEDYDVILNKGWEPFYTDFIENKLHIDMGAIRAQLADGAKMNAAFEDAGYFVYTKAAFTVINELLSGGRSMPRFMRDIYKIPDKVEAVLDVIMEWELKRARAIVRASKPEIAFVTPARGASAFFAPKLWERFVWKYTWKISSLLIEEGVAVNIHADGNWIRDIEFFKAFPKGTCIFEGDSGTDLRKVKAAVGDQLCIKGDVPPAMLSHGTPDQVHDYCTKLIADMGDGFILSSGCAIPDIAKLENVKAMISAATGE